MPFFRKRSFSFHALIAAGLLAVTGGSALAQGATTPSAAAPTSAPATAAHADSKHSAHHGRHMGRHDPAKMQAHIAKRQAELKGRLNITPAQESSWAAYTAAMQPRERGGWRMTPEQRAEMAKLSTPERIDKMRAVRTQRMAERSAAMDKRGDAVKALYAALAHEQQKLLDTEYTNWQDRKGRANRGGGRHQPAPQKG